MNPDEQAVDAHTQPLSTPSLPAPSLPAPSLPAPSLPTPSLPTPSLPTPSLPTPSLLTPRGAYQDKESTMTLQEGLAEYYLVNRGLSDPATISNEKSARFFRNHDTTHVIFGTHTGPLDEAVNDMLTFFCVKITPRDYIEGFAATDEASAIVKSYSIGTVLKMSWWTLRLLPDLWRAKKSMKKKWPWTQPTEFLDRPLSELRAEYGIDVLRPHELLGLSENIDKK